MRYHHVLVMGHHQKYFAGSKPVQRIWTILLARAQANAEFEHSVESKSVAPGRHEAAARKVFGNLSGLLYYAR